MLDSDHFRRTPCSREERGPWQSQRNTVRARRLGATGETALGVLGNRHEGKLAGRPSREVPQWLPQLAVDKRRGTDNLHKDWTEVSSSCNLSAILTLETAPGNAATSGSPPCCDIVVAHIFGPCRLYCPHLPFPLWLLLPAFASSWTHLRLSSLCPTSGGVDPPRKQLRFLYFITIIKKKRVRPLGQPTLCDLQPDPRTLQGQDWAWFSSLSCKPGGHMVHKDPSKCSSDFVCPKSFCEANHVPTLSLDLAVWDKVKIRLTRERLILNAQWHPCGISDLQWQIFGAVS